MNNLNYEGQYLGLVNRIIRDGKWVENKRTGERCLTVIGHTLQYNSGAGDVPFLSTKQSFVQTAVAEFIGYLRGYTNAQQFKDIGCPTWFKNANETQAWLDNPNRRGENDMGLVYGATTGCAETLIKIFNNLSNGIDDRGETLTFWKPEEFNQGCLRPCMRNHTFSILDGTLYLTSESRSVDVALGLNFNSIQCDFFLKWMAKICGLKVGYCTHNLINVHIYEKHLSAIRGQLLRSVKPLDCSLEIEPFQCYLNDLTGNDLHAREFIEVKYEGYAPKINFEMTA
ncbi:thymidylate synthase [Colwellia phage 9A]|uniref:thymidylate synthase n=1 Tax=Colwellia phage 9A TaxID=765765 RepID=I3UMB0_9CAUD|nr:thymidylate synthase [Colwellia phage 9A]AFK66625.1 thymidylate synthase [Colwellia phage 9A]